MKRELPKPPASKRNATKDRPQGDSKGYSTLDVSGFQRYRQRSRKWFYLFIGICLVSAIILLFVKTRSRGSEQQDADSMPTSEPVIARLPESAVRVEPQKDGNRVQNVSGENSWVLAFFSDVSSGDFERIAKWDDSYQSGMKNALSNQPEFLKEKTAQRFHENAKQKFYDVKGQNQFENQYGGLMTLLAAKPTVEIMEVQTENQWLNVFVKMTYPSPTLSPPALNSLDSLIKEVVLKINFTTDRHFIASPVVENELIYWDDPPFKIYETRVYPKPADFQMDFKFFDASESPKRATVQIGNYTVDENDISLNQKAVSVRIYNKLQETSLATELEIPITVTAFSESGNQDIIAFTIPRMIQDALDHSGTMYRFVRRPWGDCQQRPWGGPSLIDQTQAVPSSGGSQSSPSATLPTLATAPPSEEDRTRNSEVDSTKFEINSEFVKAPSPIGKRIRIDVKRVMPFQVNVSKFKILFYVYEKDGLDDISLTRSEVRHKWLSAPIDWNSDGLETLEIIYDGPNRKVSPDEEFYGYTVGVYYDEELQGDDSAPPTLAKKYPIPAVLKGVKDGSRRDSPSVQNAERDEIFPETRSRLLNAEDVEGWPPAKFRYAINEMYARHGADFTKDEIKQMFSKFDWYHPTPGKSYDAAEAEFSEIEKQNLKMLGALRDDVTRMARIDPSKITEEAESATSWSKEGGKAGRDSESHPVPSSGRKDSASGRWTGNTRSTIMWECGSVCKNQI